MKVLNMRGAGKLPPSAVRVDRTTQYGNPFVIGAAGSRDEVIAKYRTLLWERMQHEQGFAEQMLHDLDGRDLACWCAPEPCHADVIIRAIAWLKDERSV